MIDKVSNKSDRNELIRQIKKIDVITKRRVQGLQAGSHHSIFKGQGVEFTDLREYMPGDDIRSIDWKVTARLDRPFIKEFTEERDQTFYFVVDVSGSGTFGSKTAKEYKALEVVASLMFAAIRNNDRIGLCLVSDSIEKFIKAKKGRKQAILLLNILLEHQPQSKKTDLAAALHSFAFKLRRQSSIVIVSDFISPSFIREVALLRNHHEVIAIKITDPVEFELPDVGLIQLEDAETGEQLLINTSDIDTRQKYQSIVKDANQKFEQELKKSGINPISLLTTEPYDIPLKRYFLEISRGGKTNARIL